MAPIPASKPASTSTHGIINHLFARASADTRIPSLVRRFTSTVLNTRQQIVAIPATYTIPANNPSPGTVVGIVLGVVLGLAFILWVLYTVFNANNPSGATEVEIIKTRGPRKSRVEARSDRTRSEIIEVSRTRARSEPRRREIIVEEEVRRPPPEEDDVVVVIEEHSPVRRQRRSSGYRNVDPNEFGGGRRDRRGVR